MRELLAVFVVICMSASGLSASQNLSREGFLDLLETIQTRTENIEIEVHSKRYSVNRTTGELEETPYSVESRYVAKGLAGDVVRFDTHMVLPWQGPGETEFRVSEDFDWRSYNGKISMHKQRVPQLERPLVQTVGADRPSQSIRTLARLAGINLIAAYYEDTGLAQVLRQKGEKWEYESGDNGIFVIRYPREYDLEDKAIEEILIDLGRGGVIVGRKLLDSEGNVVSELGDVVLRESDEGIWLPESAQWHSFEGNLGWKISFKKVAINQDIPDNTFEIEFDPGYEVIDQVSNIRYKAGHPDKEVMLDEISPTLADVKKERDGPERTPEQMNGASADASVELETEDIAEGRKQLYVALMAAVIITATVLVIVKRRSGSVPFFL